MSKFENFRDRVEDVREWVRGHRDGLQFGGALAVSLAVGVGGGYGVYKVMDRDVNLNPEEVFLANRPIEAKCKDINSIVSVDLRRDKHGEPKAAVIYCKPVEPGK